MADADELETLSRHIAMATVALRGVVAGDRVPAPKKVKPQLTTMQHVVSLLATGTPKHYPRAQGDRRVSPIVAVTATADAGGSLQGLIAGRLLNLRPGKLWTEHPIAVLESFSQATLHPTASFPWTIALTIFAAEKLDAAGIPLPQLAVGGKYVYTVDVDYVSTWINAFTSTVWSLEDLLLDADKKDVVDNLTADNVTTASQTLVAFGDFLKSGFIDRLVTDQLLATKLSSPFLQPTLVGNHPLSTVSSPATMTDGHALSMALATAIDDGDSGDVDGSEDESSGTHAPTITAPISVIFSLTRRSALPYRLNAHIVTVPDPVINEDRVNALKQEFINSILALVSKKEKQKAHLFLQKKLRIPAVTEKPTVHAEAGMMALACAFHSHDRASASQSELAIDRDFADILTKSSQRKKWKSALAERAAGAAGSCICAFESIKLTSANRRPQASIAVPQAEFPLLTFLGSHATVLPWYPPQFGVPIEFLRELLQDLKRALASAAILGNDAASTQSSPRSSGEIETRYEALRDAYKAIKGQRNIAD
ncbi:hypothetical protein BV25DRAFT_1914870 [Artomyces pyxidatus]|uniref:Uncharacterized protein n=1 Tax=Artomyces pyxidatus TaxID=48021 RepID=A0ACB8T5U8_9AGAM|nr:hypothetical protein BV25DRAFT_1914870 [Artomyces pyxidatus]